MTQPETVSRYLERMRLKKKLFGGVDEESTLTHIARLCELYEEELEGSAGAAELEQSRKTIEGLRRSLDSLREENARQQERMEKAAKELNQSRAACREARQEAQNLRKLLGSQRKEDKVPEAQIEPRSPTDEEERRELRRLLELVDSVRTEIVQKVQAQAQKERAEAQQEIEKIRAHVESEREKAEEELRRSVQEQRGKARQEEERLNAELYQLSQRKAALEAEIEEIHKKQKELVAHLTDSISRLSGGEEPKEGAKTLELPIRPGDWRADGF